MNRISRGFATGKSPLPASAHTRNRLTIGAVDATEYSLFRPMHYEPNYAYPLVIYLHGPRGSQRQLDDLMPALSARNYTAIAPQGILQHPRSGYCWGTAPTAREVTVAFDRVMACIDVASEKLSIHPDRVFLVGYGCGGTMAMRLALKAPSLLAGAASLCGGFPIGEAPLSNLRNCRKLPLWLAAGREGKRYTIEQSCEELRLFHAAGMSVSLRQYPGGDDVDTNMLRDLNSWMMERITGATSLDAETNDAWDQSWTEESN